MSFEHFVITGTSGTGKTSLLNQMRVRGFRCFEEPVRRVLNDQLAIDGPALPAKDPSRFINEILQRCLRDLEEANLDKTPAFFDRGIPDAITYAERFGVDTGAIKVLAKASRYSGDVFLLPPWKEIFVNDEVRRATFEDYVRFHGMIRRAYEDCGYRLIEVPQASVEGRSDFVQAFIKGSRSGSAP